MFPNNNKSFEKLEEEHFVSPICEPADVSCLSFEQRSKDKIKIYYFVLFVLFILSAIYNTCTLI